MVSGGSNIYYILTSILTQDEKDHAWKAVRDHTDKHQQQDNTLPSGRKQPLWGAQVGIVSTLAPGQNTWQQGLAIYLAEGMQHSAHSRVNFDTLQEVTQDTSA